jgi:hypothetical protein
MKTPHLSLIRSTGPKKYISSIDGEPRQFSSPCGICATAISEGRDISYFRGSWVHATCASNTLISGSAVNAWLVLGADLARHPRAYNVADTKSIVNQLMKMAAGMQPEALDYEEYA